MNQSFIDRLKEHPRHKRHMYAAGSSLVIVAIIFGVWISVGNSGVNGDGQVMAVQERREEKSGESFASFKSSMAQIFTGFQTVVETVKGTFSGNNDVYQSEDPFRIK